MVQMQKHPIGVSSFIVLLREATFGPISLNFFGTPGLLVGLTGVSIRWGRVCT